MSDEADDSPFPAPRANPDLVGHEAAERTFLEGFRGGQLHHAWLISGPQGVGKATLAYRFARFLLKGEGSEAGGGGLFGPAEPAAEGLYVAPQDPVFRRTASGGHADLLTVERQVDEKTGRMRGEIAADDAREIGPFLRLTAAEGGWRVVVIDSADDLNTHSANALLKSLEEPPKRAILLLVSHNPGRLLPTIRSRCRKLVLKPLDDRQVTDLLRRYHPDLEAEDAQLLARLAEGSPGRALALAGEGGIDIHRSVEDLLKTLPRLDLMRLHALGDKLNKRGESDGFETAMSLLRWRLGQIIRQRSTGAAAPAGDDWTARLAQAGSLERWLEVWDKINRLVARTDSVNLDRKQVVLNVFLALEEAVRG